MTDADTSVTPRVNDVTLTASIVERKALRYTPAGLPALDLGLHHESTVVEAGQPRKVVCDLRAVALGPMAVQLSRTDIGAELQIKGFLGMSRNGRGVLLHIIELN
ncbi:MAG TPA: primosomal replication protein N [Aquabacterium sp.]|uniref:primosomal replication protein N n=1 Tax=Aquabacterium sp. TaxID=1872578 RepID=UPI002E30ABA2|nr:primosomal replication protein N [Aquabacterium sp.]HEX5374486.1 primosomal replication protein N [Aquabacterium sp.]